MSKLAVSIIETPDAFSDLTIKTANAAGPTLVMSSSNNKIYLNGALNGLDFPEVRDAANTAYAAADTANASSGVATSAYGQANTARNQANAAFTQANTAITNAGNAFGKANTAAIDAVNAFSQANTATEIIPAGTTMLFFQAAAPTGWTQVTTQNNKALRVVSGTGGGTGGTTDFTSVFTSRTPAGTVGSTTLTAAQSGVPAHSHGITDPGHVHAISLGGTDGTAGRVDSSSSAQAQTFNTNSNTTGITINNNVATNASQGHDHTWTGTAMDFAVQYIDVIIASKN